jgi:small-conductance mechanosensitive channel/CRP-like cAMP-binding protein
VVVLSLAALALRRGERLKLLRTPIVFFVLHLLCVGVRLLLPVESSGAQAFQVIGFAFLLIALARATFILVVDGILAERLEKPISRILRDITQALVYAGVAITVLRDVGVEPGSLLTTSALITAIIGLSLQETLGNLFAGLAIQAQRPFEVGDWIGIERDARAVGQVIEINWRSTTVLTGGRVELTIPNGVLAKSTINNYTKPTPMSRREIFVQAPYEIAPPRVHEALLSVVTDVDGILSTPAPGVQTRNFAESGIDYRFTYFVEDFLQGDRIDSEIRQRIWYALQRARISIPFPIRTVQMYTVTPEVNTEATKLEVARRKASLLRVDFLRLLPEESLDRLASLSRTLPFMPGEPVIRQGNPGSELYIVQRGELAVDVGRDETHSVAELARLGPGEFFGEMSLMTGESRSATVRAFTECEIVEVSKEAFQTVIASEPRFVEAITRVLAERQSKIEENLTARAKRSKTMDEASSQALLDKIRKFFQL